MPPRCSICGHEKRVKIDKDLLDPAVSLRTIADHWSVSKTALIRHRDGGHILEKLAKATAAAEVARGDSLLDQLRALLTRANATLDRAERVKGKTAVRDRCAALREARETLRLLAQVAGELETAPTVNVLITSPEWLATRAALMEALAPFPAARVAAGEALAKLHAGA